MSASLGILVLALLAGGAPLPHPRAHAFAGPRATTSAPVTDGLRAIEWGPRTDSPALNPPRAAAPDPEPDPWVGPDKLQHFGMSFAATSFAYGTARFALDRPAATRAAAAAALAAGLAKEILDLRAGRSFSVRDLFWDAAGVAVALTLVDRTR